MNSKSISFEGLGAFLVLLVIFIVLPWYSNSQKHDWAIQHEKELESKGFKLIHSEKKGDLINPFSWFHTPKFRLYFLERNGVSTFPDGTLRCGLQVLETNDFDTENRSFLMIYYKPEEKLMRIDEHDIMWNPIHKGEFQKPRGVMEKITNYLIEDS